MINVEKLLEERAPSLYTKHEVFRRSFLFFFKRLFRERELNQFILDNEKLTGFDFVDSVLDFYNFSYSTNHKELENIPASGRAIIVANHPLGALDGLALLSLVSRIRPDVKIIANELLAYLNPIEELFLPVDNMGNQSTRRQITDVVNWLNNDHCVIIFPAGEVSRAGLFGIKDTHWRKSFLSFSEKTNSPVIPMHVEGKNSLLFYVASMLYKPFSSFLLVREMFKQYSRSLKITIGEQIDSQELAEMNLAAPMRAKLVRKHLYRIGSNRPGILKTAKAIAHPQERQALKNALASCEVLGETRDGKQMLLYQYNVRTAIVMKELGRLRELTFRYVGEGTGKRLDTDEYDYHYDHLILWDESNLEIVGAYRFGQTQKIIQAKGMKGLYTSTFYEFQPKMTGYLEEALELGRSFVQPKYWGKRSLDYLWYGIGAYLRKHPNLRYLYGQVSISNSYPRFAKEMLVYFYQLHFASDEVLLRSDSPFTIDSKRIEQFESLFEGKSHTEDFVVLKRQLANLGVSVPTLYKQYTDLTEPGGVRFLEFSVDKDFNNCLDGLVFVDIHQLKEQKYARYIASQQNESPRKSA